MIRPLRPFVRLAKASPRLAAVAVVGLVLAACSSAEEADTPDFNSTTSNASVARGTAGRGGDMGLDLVLAVAIPAIEQAGGEADYRNCVKNGCDGIDGLCYSECAEGYEFVNPFVSRCFKKGGSGQSYDRGRGRMYCYQGHPIDPPEYYRRNCESNGCDYTGGLCYKRCPEGWVVSATEPTSCTKPCPPYYNDTGGTCYRGIHPIHSIMKLPRSDWFMGRGAGRISCENGNPR
jgi:hypothetical protein